MSSLNDIEQALIDAQDYFHNRANVNDGDYGVSDPNWEMVLDNQMSGALSQIDDLRQTLARPPTPDAGAMPDILSAVEAKRAEWINQANSLAASFTHYAHNKAKVEAADEILRDLRAYRRTQGDRVMSITYGGYLIDIGHYDITPEQERELEAREECDKRGINPDELCADGGMSAWMVIDQEMQDRLYERKRAARKECEPSDEMVERALDKFCDEGHSAQGNRLHLDAPFAISFQSSLRRMRAALHVARKETGR